MAKSSTPSFITDIPLSVSSAEEKVLLSRLEAGRQLYNACLGEAMRRLKLVKQSKLYQFACSLPKTKTIKGESKPNPERKKAFRAAWDAYSFSDYSIQDYARHASNCWIKEHISGHVVQKIGKRAYLAASKVIFGKAKRVRFKGKNQFDSVEGKENSGLSWKDEQLRWKGLKISPLINRNDPVILHGLNSPVKYVRLVRRKVKGRNRFYVQLVNEGIPFRKPKNKAGDDTIGLDVGPSTIAVVGTNKAFLRGFCPELKDLSQQIKRLQRKLSRSARANNPDCFEPSLCKLPKPGQKHGKRKLGKSVKGKRHSKQSKAYLQARARKANLERILAAHRKSLQGALVHEIVAMGKSINTEKLSYKAWHKMFGRSVGRNAPGMFIARLKQIAESAGGYLNEFPTKETKLSQRCICGQFKKKSLSERIHQCRCGVTAQRDLFSGYLARFVDLDGQFQAEPAQSEFHGVDSLLMSAWNSAYSKHTQSSIGKPSLVASVPATGAIERVGKNSSPTRAKTPDDVGHGLQLSLFPRAGERH